jgi:hypothetical protein
MNKKAIIKILQIVTDNVTFEISGYAARGGLYAAALAGEGYQGGYRDALQDCILLINGNVPRRRQYWDFLIQTALEKRIH